MIALNIKEGYETATGKFKAKVAEDPSYKEGLVDGIPVGVVVTVGVLAAAVWVVSLFRN